MVDGDGDVPRQILAADERPLLVGECPSPAFVDHPNVSPLFGRPARVLWTTAELGSPGMSDLRIYVMLRRLARLENLCRRTWDLREAESRAATLLGERPDATFVLLGRRVARAFGCRDATWYEPRRYCGTATVIVLPHPSGLNRMWNDADMRVSAGAALRAALGLTT